MSLQSIEPISIENIQPLTELMLELWPDCSFNEEYENCVRILKSENETCFLVREGKNYVAFIQLAIRFDYVEGSTNPSIAYVEGIYVKPSFRRIGVGNRLITCGKDWAAQKGYKQLVEIPPKLTTSFRDKVTT